MIEVTLEYYEVAQAAHVGQLRNLSAMSRGYETKIPGREWQAHIEGACGEIAVAKAAGKYWGGSINTFKDGGDIASTGWEVRTRSSHDHDLIIRDSDPDGRVFILVTGLSPTFRIHGWIKSEDAKREEWRKDYGGHGLAYFLPQKLLKKWEDLFVN